jgi:DNA-binding transcriptional LysR family regulator
MFYSSRNSDDHHWQVDFRDMRYALLASELRSFAKAASHLRIKKATLSRHISYLEQRLGTALFIRSPRGVAPTEAGLVFIERARRVFDELEGLQERTRAVAQGRAGSLGIGFATSISAGNLRASLIAFHEANRDVQLRGVENEREHLFRKLETGSLDILIVSGSINIRGTYRLSLWSERMLVALPAQHALEKHDVVYWAELQGETFLAPQTTADDIQAMIQARFPQAGGRPVIKLTELTRETILGLVSAGRGITLVSAGSAGLRVENVVLRELHDTTGPHTLDYSAYWRSDNRNPALQTFIGFMRDRYSLAILGA